MNKQAKERPTFTGLTWYREQFFSFFVPIDWQKVERQDNKDGIIYVPPEEDNRTLFAVEVTDLGTTVTSDDIPYLTMGFHKGIKELPQGKILDKKEKVVGNLIQLEASYTFMEDDVERKRWVRILYHDTRQITVIAQGVTVESFDYWLPMFFEAMMTLKVHRTRPTEP